MWTLCPTTSSPDECWRCLVCDLKFTTTKIYQKKGRKSSLLPFFDVSWRVKIEFEEVWPQPHKVWRIDPCWSMSVSPPQEKNPQKGPPESEDTIYFLKSYESHIYIYIQSSFSLLISRFWRVYHPHWKKSKGFFQKPYERSMAPWVNSGPPCCRSQGDFSATSPRESYILKDGWCEDHILKQWVIWMSEGHVIFLFSCSQDGCECRSYPRLMILRDLPTEFCAFQWLWTLWAAIILSHSIRNYHDWPLFHLQLRA